MAYEEYQLGKWTVTETQNAECARDALVTFTVIVSCGGRPFAIGEYDRETNKIVRAGEYEICINEVGPKRQIKFLPKNGSIGPDGSITGSWTAEDPGPWPGDG
jgi:hypothetical protein